MTFSSLERCEGFRESSSISFECVTFRGGDSQAEVAQGCRSAGNADFKAAAVLRACENRKIGKRSLLPVIGRVERTLTFRRDIRMVGVRRILIRLALSLFLEQRRG